MKEKGERDKTDADTRQLVHISLSQPLIHVSLLSMQQGFYADEVSAGAGHTTTTVLLCSLRQVSTVQQTENLCSNGQ